MTDQYVADKLAIRDVLSNYCRGLDRMDKEMAYAVFSKDCSAHYYGMFEGSGHGFVDWAWEVHATMSRHSHQITNALIEVNGSTAVSESYVTVALWTKAPDITEITCRGRYLDHWQRCEDAWQIVRREHILDMQSNNGVPVPDAVNQQSRRDANDPSFKLF
jgi:hypothetical protein